MYIEKTIRHTPQYSSSSENILKFLHKKVIFAEFGQSKSAGYIKQYYLLSRTALTVDQLKIANDLDIMANFLCCFMGSICLFVVILIILYKKNVDSKDLKYPKNLKRHVV